MLYLVIIPLGLLFVPWLLVRYVFVAARTKDLPYWPLAWYLWVASGLWVLSQLLPNVPISPETDTFTMHFIGGITAAVLYIYVMRAYNLKFSHTWQLWVGLYLFVSALGVLNELFEFFLDESGLMPMPSDDTWWDLTANTLGAFMAYALIRIYLGLRKKYHLL
jgi:hypothetical protein